MFILYSGLFIKRKGVAKNYFEKSPCGTQPEFGNIWLEILNSQFTEVIYLSKCPCPVGLSFLNCNNFRYCFVVLSPWTYTQA